MVHKIGKKEEISCFEQGCGLANPDSHKCGLPDPGPDFKKVTFIILILLFDICGRKYMFTSNISGSLNIRQN
jgi:hypothetical protein